MSCLKHIPGSSSSLECKDRKERIQSADMSLFMWDELLIPSKEEFLFLVFKVFLNRYLSLSTQKDVMCVIYLLIYLHIILKRQLF